MAFEMLVGLQVSNDEIYTQYRKAMTPILTQYQGSFTSDFKVSEALLTPDNAMINRVFTICFKDKAHMEAFFSDADYLAVKQAYFEKSVAQTCIISSYEK